MKRDALPGLSLRKGADSVCRDKSLRNGNHVAVACSEPGGGNECSFFQSHQDQGTKKNAVRVSLVGDAQQK